MSLIVQKFGGSSVADAEKLLHISHIIRTSRGAGDDVIVVVSAQGNTTDQLIRRAKSVASQPDARELDALLATGEQASAAMTAMALQSLGVPAVSLGAWQVPIRSGGEHGDGCIEDIGRERIEKELAAGRIVVVAGFQGLDRNGDLATLGRGGSDYSAVALAAAFHAARCLIYTDVDGVYTADPRICPTARRLARVSYADMYALARAGARVLHDKCVALAQAKGVEPEVLSCVAGSCGTRIVPSAQRLRGVTGVTRRIGAHDTYAAVTLVGGALPSLELEKRAILALNAANIVVHGIDAGERTLTLYVEPIRADEAVRCIHDAVII